MYVRMYIKVQFVKETDNFYFRISDPSRTSDGRWGHRTAIGTRCGGISTWTTGFWCRAGGCGERSLNSISCWKVNLCLLIVYIHVHLEYRLSNLHLTGTPRWRHILPGWAAERWGSLYDSFRFLECTICGKSACMQWLYGTHDEVPILCTSSDPSTRRSVPWLLIFVGHPDIDVWCGLMWWIFLNTWCLRPGFLQSRSAGESSAWLHHGSWADHGFLEVLDAT